MTNDIDTPDTRLAHLGYFTGTENWYRHALVRSITFTDGAKYVADQVGAYWLLDEIALANRYNAAVQGEGFQAWTLTVRPDARATLRCEDGNGGEVQAKELDFTDFPAPGITLWCCDHVIMLPSEY